MIKRLSISNYVLIDKLSIEFNEGFTSITGKTGAGKSILLGALGLILGDRADTQSLANDKRKCIVEAEFQINKYTLQSFFKENDLDYFDLAVVRREISPNGRSRAFINDTPVNLNLLKQISQFLVDIHSQHQTLLINKQDYQLNIIDSYCNNDTLIQTFKEKFSFYKQQLSDLKTLIDKENTLKNEIDYKTFLLNEIEEVKVTKSDDDIDDELIQLENFEEINSKLSLSTELSETNEYSILSLLNELVSNLESIKDKDRNILPVSDRINSLYIDFKDCLYELNALNESYNDGFDNKRLAFLQERSNLINRLLYKHSLKDVNQLISFKEQLKTDLEKIGSIDEEIETLKKVCELSYKQANELAIELSSKRLKGIPTLEKEIISLASDLGMPNSTLIISQKSKSELSSTGIDDFSFNFSANKGVEAMEISKIASGGELSRLMLCFKYILAQKANLSCILFDEIDTGVSGNIAHKMAKLMKKMSSNMQVISITHLPQVAAKANSQLLVSKIENEDKTITTIKELSKDERVVELANMLSGHSVTESSLKNADDLLNT
ncbi:MAG: DNA repair protein RecN [Flavobacteriales bacterium]|nr:DNA repair protein RecN [Flavobacteriales bacterium]MBL6873754.1 DNA repair protein RecN [Flavobacteriales bacterium]